MMRPTRRQRVIRLVDLGLFPLAQSDRRFCGPRSDGVRVPHGPGRRCDGCLVRQVQRPRGNRRRIVPVYRCRNGIGPDRTFRLRAWGYGNGRHRRQPGPVGSGRSFPCTGRLCRAVARCRNKRSPHRFVAAWYRAVGNIGNWRDAGASGGPEALPGSHRMRWGGTAKGAIGCKGAVRFAPGRRGIRHEKGRIDRRRRRARRPCVKRRHGTRIRWRWACSGRRACDAQKAWVGYLQGMRILRGPQAQPKGVVAGRVASARWHIGLRRRLRRVCPLAVRGGWPLLRGPCFGQNGTGRKAGIDRSCGGAKVQPCQQRRKDHIGRGIVPCMGRGSAIRRRGRQYTRQRRHHHRDSRRQTRILPRQGDPAGNRLPGVYRLGPDWWASDTGGSRMTVALPPALSPTAPRPEDAARDALLRTRAAELETAFLAEMLGHAGLGAPAQGFGGGIGEEQFASFLRREQAAAMTQAGGIGLAESIFRALAARDDI